MLGFADSTIKMAAPAAAPMDFASPRACLDFFKTLLRFRTVSAEGPRTGAYTACVAWLDAQCRAVGLETRIVTPVEGKPILVATWKGGACFLFPLSAFPVCIFRRGLD